MRRLITWLAAALLAVLLALAALLLIAIDRQPLVERGTAISPIAIAQARELLSRHDPRQQASGEIATVAIPANLIDEGVNYLAGRYLRGRGAFVLSEEAGEFRVTLPIVGQRYLNFRASLRPGEGMPGVDQARLGGIAVPGPLVDALIAKAVAAAGLSREWQVATRSIQQFAIDAASATVSITYVWEPLILDHARAIALSPEKVRQLRAAHLALAALLSHRAPGSIVSLAEILHAALPHASDPVGHGRAVLFVLASQLARVDLATFVPATRAWPRIRWVRITLAGRHDLAQHFVISATLAAWSGEPVADAIGLYKELDDARRGSGFSFVDLAADRAGTRFGEIVARNPERLAERLAAGLSERDLLPAIGGLPEYLNAERFRNDYESPDSPQFKAMSRDIENRLSSLPLYRP
jgi:hypothetical protein